MGIPKTKAELLQQSESNFENLNALVDSYSKTELLSEFPAGTMNRNIRDVLAHLHHWHLMFLKWYEVGMRGEKPEMPAEGYSWKDTKALNRLIWESYRNHELGEVRIALQESHKEVQEIIRAHSETELFEKKYYHWTGSSSLGTYLRGNSSSHYLWAYKLIKKAMK